MTFVAAFLASFFFIATKALQQRQVMYDEYLFIIPASLFMAFCEVYVVHNIAVHGWSMPLVLSVGLGSGLGCVTAMQLHRRYRLNGRKVQTHE